MAHHVPLLRHLVCRGLQYDQVEYCRNEVSELFYQAQFPRHVGIYDDRVSSNFFSSRFGSLYFQGGLESVYARFVRVFGLPPLYHLTLLQVLSSILVAPMPSLPSLILIVEAWDGHSHCLLHGICLAWWVSAPIFTLLWTDDSPVHLRQLVYW